MENEERLPAIPSSAAENEQYGKKFTRSQILDERRKRYIPPGYIRTHYRSNLGIVVWINPEPTVEGYQALYFKNTRTIPINRTYASYEEAIKFFDEFIALAESERDYMRAQHKNRHNLQPDEIFVVLKKPYRFFQLMRVISKNMVKVREISFHQTVDYQGNLVLIPNRNAFINKAVAKSFKKGRISIARDRYAQKLEDAHVRILLDVSEKTSGDKNCPLHVRIFLKLKRTLKAACQKLNHK